MTYEVKSGSRVSVPGSVYTQTQGGKYVVQIDSGPYAADQLAPWVSAEEWGAIEGLTKAVLALRVAMTKNWPAVCAAQAEVDQATDRCAPLIERMDW